MARERDILASLGHQHIARLYDAGHTEAGRLYLAMEFVEGEPITAYAARHKLSVPWRGCACCCRWPLPRPMPMPTWWCTET